MHYTKQYKNILIIQTDIDKSITLSDGHNFFFIMRTQTLRVKYWEKIYDFDHGPMEAIHNTGKLFQVSSVQQGLFQTKAGFFFTFNNF